MVKLPGERLLLVVGILLIIAGVFNGFGAVRNISDAFQINSSTLVVATIFLFLAAALEIITGILGIAGRKRVDRWTVLVLFGGAIVALILTSNVMYYVGLRELGVTGVANSPVSIIFGILLPVCLIIGALRNRKHG
ncbi:MAG: hypothetical protein LBL36_01635 [Clostridiales Family XIII bacterium]|jgi:hypothetical protein|nr:hypothetical protein [Clostridiales Family XIII bacterium]